MSEKFSNSCHCSDEWEIINIRHRSQKKDIGRLAAFFFLCGTIRIQISSPAHLDNILGRRVPKKKNIGSDVSAYH